jgi:HEAT repeat protein/beta-lactamase regulating signal transducer with metallopeptidase domain
MIGILEWAPLLLGAAVKGTLLIGLAAVAAAVLKRSSAATRHLVWQLALSGMLILPFVSETVPWRLSVGPAFPKFTERFVKANLPSSESMPTPASSKKQASVADNTSADVARDHAPPHASFAGDVSMPRAIVTQDLAGSLLLVWLVVAALLLARVVIGFVVVQMYAFRGKRLFMNGWYDLNEQLSAAVGLSRPVALLRSEYTRMPMTWGVMNPIVMLPADCDSWTDERRRIVLLHELAHVRRLDSLVHIIGQAACALYWFNPLVWLAAARLRTEAERAADDLVLRTGTRASVYADHLLEMVRSIGRVHTPALALPMAQRSSFEGRLLAILEPGIQRAAPRRTQALACGVFAALIVIPLAALRPADASAAEEATSHANSMITHDNAETSQPVTETESHDVTHEQERTSNEPAEPQPQAGAVLALVGSLSDSNAEVREAAARSLGNLQEPRAVEALMNAMTTDTDAEVRRTAAWALGQIEDERAVPALIRALSDDRDVEVRRTAVWALGQIEDRSAVKALAAALRDADEEIRGQAVWALGQIEAPEAVEPLLPLLRDATADVRKQAAWALGQIESETAVGGLSAMLASDANKDVRETAAWALGQIESTSAMPALTTALRDASPDVRGNAAWAIGQIEPATAPPQLIVLLKDADSEVRKKAAWALSQIGDPAAYEAFADMLKDPDPEIRKRAAEALGRHGGRPDPQPRPQPRPRPND